MKKAIYILTVSMIMLGSCTSNETKVTEEMDKASMELDRKIKELEAQREKNLDNYVNTLDTLSK
jgi:uncharacterized protein YcfL